MSCLHDLNAWYLWTGINAHQRVYQLPSEVCSLEGEWEKYKATLLKAAKDICGKKKNGKRWSETKQSLWLCEEVKQAVKKKKDLYKPWIKTQREEHCVNYRLQHRETNQKKFKSKELILGALWSIFSWKWEISLQNILVRSMREGVRITIPQK